MDVQGRVAIITGGASGLGEAVARRLVTSGAQVVIVDLDERRGAAVAADLGDAAGFVRASVTDEYAVSAAVSKAAKLGELRVAVNCAGVGVPSARTVARGNIPYPLDRFAHAVQVNLVGTFNVTRLAAAGMGRFPGVDGGRGVIVNTSSVAAYDGQTGQVAYSAAKAGVAGMTLPLARDLSPLGIRVCTIAPGTFDTPIFDGPGSPDDVAGFKHALIADNAFPHRLGHADEFAVLVEHVIVNDMLNAETIRLDAGVRLRASPRPSQPSDKSQV